MIKQLCLQQHYCRLRQQPNVNIINHRVIIAITKTKLVFLNTITPIIQTTTTPSLVPPQHCNNNSHNFVRMLLLSKMTVLIITVITVVATTTTILMIMHHKYRNNNKLNNNNNLIVTPSAMIQMLIVMQMLAVIPITSNNEHISHFNCFHYSIHSEIKRGKKMCNLPQSLLINGFNFFPQWIEGKYSKKKEHWLETSEVLDSCFQIL